MSYQFLCSYVYITGRTMSTLNPSASMMQKNMPAPGSITPLSMREMDAMDLRKRAFTVSQL